MHDNTLIVVQGGEHPALFSPALLADSAHWIAGTPPALPLRCQARIRHRQALQWCTVDIADPALGDTARNQGKADQETLLVQFEQDQRAITAGQSVVFYVDDECLGGAVIDATVDQCQQWPQC